MLTLPLIFSDRNPVTCTGNAFLPRLIMNVNADSFYIWGVVTNDNAYVTHQQQQWQSFSFLLKTFLQLVVCYVFKVKILKEHFFFTNPRGVKQVWKLAASMYCSVLLVFTKYLVKISVIVQLSFWRLFFDVSANKKNLNF